MLNLESISVSYGKHAVLSGLDLTIKEGEQKYLLRVSDKGKLDSKKIEFDMMEKIASLGVRMCKPIKFEFCGDEVHSIHEWIDEKNAIDTIDRRAHV